MSRSVVWTNAAFFPAIIIAVVKGIFAACFLYTLLYVTSTAYHYSREKEWRLQDHIMAWSVMAWNGVAFFRAMGTDQGNPISAIIGLLFAVVALMVYLKVPSKDEEYFRLFQM